MSITYEDLKKNAGRIVRIFHDAQSGSHVDFRIGFPRALQSFGLEAIDLSYGKTTMTITSDAKPIICRNFIFLSQQE